MIGTGQTYRLPSFARFRQDHEHICVLTKTVAAGFQCISKFPDSTRDIQVNELMRSSSTHWEGTTIGVTTDKAISDATITLSRLLILASLASFEGFIASCEGELDSIDIPATTPATNTEPASGLVARVERLSRRVKRQWPADSKHYLTLLHFFVLLRNRVAHTSGATSHVEYQELIKSGKIAPALKTVATQTKSGQIPKLPDLSGSSLPRLEFPHVILSCVVCHRIANGVNDWVCDYIKEEGLIRLAAREVKKTIPLPPKNRPLGRGSAVNRVLVDVMGFRNWNSKHTIQRLKALNIWDDLQNC